MRSFGLVVGLEAHGPREVLWIVPPGGAGGDKQLRHLVIVHVALDRGVGRSAQRVEDQQHLVALDQPPRLFHRRRRTVGIVVGDEGDLAAVDAALLVDLVEVGNLGLADHAIGGRRPTIRHDVADLDLGVAGAGIVLAGGNGTSGGGEDDGGRQCCGAQNCWAHGLSPAKFFFFGSAMWEAPASFQRSKANPSKTLGEGNVPRLAAASGRR